MRFLLLRFRNRQFTILVACISLLLYSVWAGFQNNRLERINHQLLVEKDSLKAENSIKQHRIKYLLQFHDTSGSRLPDLTGVSFIADTVLQYSN